MTPSYKTHDPKGWCGDPQRGAALGRHAHKPADTPSYTGTLTIERKPLIGDYDENGTYWGGDTPLYWISSEDGAVDFCWRGPSWGHAHRAVAREFPRATIAPQGGEEMRLGYMEAILAYENDGEGEDSLADTGHDVMNFSAEAIAIIRETCDRFRAENADLIAKAAALTEYQIGWDLWLTQCESGVDFRDRKIPRDVAEALVRAADKLKRRWVTVSDERDEHGCGKIYLD